jgi:hypothetical protein
MEFLSLCSFDFEFKSILIIGHRPAGPPLRNRKIVAIHARVFRMWQKCSVSAGCRDGKILMNSPNLLRTPLWPSLYKYKAFRLLQSTALVPMSTQPNSSDSFLRRIRIYQRLSPNIILHYDATSQDLQVWFWCVYIQFRHDLAQTHSVS